MTKSGNLWAVGYDDMGRANQVRDEIISLGWDKHYLILDDVAVVVRHPDGSITLDREAFPAASNALGCSVVGFLAGLVLGAPLVGAIYHPGATIATNGQVIPGATATVSNNVSVTFDIGSLPSMLDTPGNRKAMPGADPSKWVRPECIAQTLIFLASDEATQINGALIPIG